jgi:hypothetical protein
MMAKREECESSRTHDEKECELVESKDSVVYVVKRWWRKK